MYYNTPRSPEMLQHRYLANHPCEIDKQILILGTSKKSAVKEEYKSNLISHYLNEHY